MARIRPAAVWAASRIATADCSAAAATSLVLPSIPRAELAVARVRSVRTLDWSVLARTSSANSALELLALLVARVRRFDRLEKRHLGKNDVGFERGQPAEGGDAALERVELFRIAVEQAGEDLRFQLVAGSNVGRDRGALGVDAAAIFGDGLDPARIDLAGIMRLDLGGGVRSELRAHFRLDDVAGFVPKLADIPFQRSARIVSGEPVAHLLVGEPLQLSMIPTHRSPFRKPVSRRSALRPDLLLPHIG